MIDDGINHGPGIVILEAGSGTANRRTVTCNVFGTDQATVQIQDAAGAWWRIALPGVVVSYPRSPRDRAALLAG